MIDDAYSIVPPNEHPLPDLNPTTRCYPRTLVEAFPDTVERAQWLYPPEPRKRTPVELMMITVGLLGWIGLAYYFAKN